MRKIQRENRKEQINCEKYQGKRGKRGKKEQEKVTIIMPCKYRSRKIVLQRKSEKNIGGGKL